MDLHEHPQSEFVAGFIGSPRMNFLAGERPDISAQGASERLSNSHAYLMTYDL